MSKKVVSFNVIHAEIAMSVDQLSNVGDGQFEEINKLRGILNAKLPIVPIVKPEDATIDQLGRENKVTDEEELTNTQFKKSARKFLLSSFITSFSLQLIILLTSIPTATDDAYEFFWHESILWVFFALSLAIALIVHACSKVMVIPNILNALFLALF